ncbi:hypothetical protein KGA65_00990 [Ideonella sp. B7]|uniref:hypothetical protein n=1 Tax=Ideonella benzenivorans TaxID=2831643 RepID=UPI001CED140C|nr:hypothetical protein [Ideonella benzenivorans]MCA6215103.1 hypothetical protein [Ideonella benzenivorans]
MPTLALPFPLWSRLGGLSLLWALGLMPAAHAQDAVQTNPGERACKTEVSKFEETIGFLRNAQGTEAAAKLKEELLPAQTEHEILMTQGYCGLVKHLKRKHLL